MTKKLKTYNKFVEYYDEIIRGNGYNLGTELEFLHANISQYFSVGGVVKDEIKVLEFACGTGTIAHELEKKGCKVTGVDLSEQMITHAGKGNFFIGDMTSIDLKKKFDVVLCNYNSVCHLKDWNAWKDFFQNAYRHLDKDGIFIFDILTLFEFENISRDFKGFFNVRGDTICLEMFKEKDTNIFNWLIQMFVHKGDNQFELIEEGIREISFPIDSIVNELEVTGFTLQHMEDFHFGTVNDESERVYFIAKK